MSSASQLWLQMFNFTDAFNQNSRQTWQHTLQSIDKCFYAIILVTQWIKYKQAASLEPHEFELLVKYVSIEAIHLPAIKKSFFCIGHSAYLLLLLVIMCIYVKTVVCYCLFFFEMLNSFFSQTLKQLCIWMDIDIYVQNCLSAKDKNNNAQKCSLFEHESVFQKNFHTLYNKDWNPFIPSKQFLA